MCSMSFGFGFLDVRLEFGVEGCYILTCNNIGQGEGDVSFEDGDYV